MFIKKEYIENRRKKIIIGHSYWGRGGAEIATMHLILVLKDKYEVTVFTRGGWNLEELNRSAGTSIGESEIAVKYPPFANILKMTFGGAVWDGLYRKYCKAIAPNYDLCITASRVLDWGAPAIHFLSDVAWNVELQKEFKSIELEHKKRFPRNILFKIGDWLAGSSKRSPLIYDLFIANSKWTAKFSQNYCTRSIKVVSPVISGAFLQKRLNEREKCFVVLGRISPEKKIEDCIEILKKVKEKGYPIFLDIIGQFDNTEYSGEIKSICNREKDWINLRGSIYGEKKIELLSDFRYGISACDCEAFGIATGEMIKAGIIPFVPYDGAQKELVYNEELVYKNKEDAVNKIIKIINSKKEQSDLQQYLLSSDNNLSSVNFTKSVISILEEEIQKNIKCNEILK